MRRSPLVIRLLAALALLTLAPGCARTSEVVELESGLFALSQRAPSAASAARLGVERARRWCADRNLGFEPIRTEIGQPDYSIAFRCPWQPEVPTGTGPDPITVTPPLPAASPGFRPGPGLL